MTGIISFLMLFSAITFAEQRVIPTHSCHVRKSLVWVTEDGKINSRVAVTAEFPVVVDEHEAPYALPLLEKSGELWGEVMVSTGTLLNHHTDGDAKQANASVLDINGNVLTRVAAVFDIEAKLARASTVIDIKDEDLDPHLSIECRIQ